MTEFYRASVDGVEIDGAFRQNPVLNLEHITQFVKTEHGGLIIGSKKYPAIEFAGLRVMWYYEEEAQRDHDYKVISENQYDR